MDPRRALLLQAAQLAQTLLGLNHAALLPYDLTGMKRRAQGSAPISLHDVEYAGHVFEEAVHLLRKGEG